MFLLQVVVLDQTSLLGDDEIQALCVANQGVQNSAFPGGQGNGCGAECAWRAPVGDLPPLQQGGEWRT